MILQLLFLVEINCIKVQLRTNSITTKETHNILTSFTNGGTCNYIRELRHWDIKTMPSTITSEITDNYTFFNGSLSNVECSGIITKQIELVVAFCCRFHSDV